MKKNRCFNRQGAGQPQGLIGREYFAQILPLCFSKAISLKWLWLLLPGLALVVGSAFGQDFQFAHALFLPQTANPAAVGHQSLYRTQVAALYRGQWDNPVHSNAYTGAAVAADVRFCLAGQHKNFFALGLALQHDGSPLGGLSNTAGRLAGAFHLHLGRETFASAGAYVGGLAYRVSPEELKFDAQYQNGAFNPLASNGEDFERVAALKADMGSGLEVYNNVKGFSAGFAFHHLNQPSYSFLSDDGNRVGISWLAHGSLSLGRQRVWLLRGLWRRQSFGGGNSAQWQAMAGAFYQWRFSASGARAQLSTGGYVRWGGRHKAALAANTVVPTVQLGNDHFSLILAYEAPLQAVRPRFSGGLEVALAYSFGRADRCISCRGPGL
jgi:hypothetical protein